MVPQWHSSVSGRNKSPHRIIVVTVAVDNSDSDVINYSGYLLSSQVNKANINNKRYPNNIYISNYDSILKEGRTYNDRPVILKIDELITFTNQDLKDKGTWKGHISDEFSTFMDTCVRNYRLNRTMNRIVYWDREGSHNG